MTASAALSFEIAAMVHEGQQNKKGKGKILCGFQTLHMTVVRKYPGDDEACVCVCRIFVNICSELLSAVEPF